ncbi:MAG TPA: NAD(+) synthase [archaeon]|nr:NAD(+) synthase [archaeon]
MRFALAQMNPTGGDIRGNARKILDYVERARQSSADVVVFPEMALTGYCISDLVEDRRFLYANMDAVQKLAARMRGISAVVGFIDCEPENPMRRKYNAAAVLSEGRVAGVAHKTLLPNYKYFDDKRYFLEGKERRPIEVRARGQSVKLGVSICEDMWDNDYETKPVPELAEKGAEIILNTNASPFFAGKRMKREDVIKRHVKQTGLPFAYVNTVGAADNGKNIIPFDGQSLVCNSGGKLIAVGKQFEEDLIFFDFGEKDIAGDEVEPPVFDREKEIYEALVMSLRDYARKTGFSRAIQSVSGGIDSALGLAITAEAFGAEKVVAHNLPTRFNTETTKSIARRIAENLGVEYRVIPIQELYEIARRAGLPAGSQEDSVTDQNIQARARGMLMMRESNRTGALLLSNGNKTEFALGYATLYGDMCGGISLIGDLSKTDVYKLARYVNRKSGREIIPEETFRIKPSAELSEGQFDPFDYYVVSPLVDEFVVRRMDPAELVELFKERKLDPRSFEPDAEGKTVYDKHTAESFARLVDETYKSFRKSVFKRVQAPPIIAVTERAFGFDLRESIMNGWDGKEVEL